MAPNAPNPIDIQSMDNAAVAQVRQLVADVIDPRYDTEWNMLRWLQSNEFNIPKTVHLLKKHLKWRSDRKLDEPEPESLLQFSEARRKHAPIDIIGPQRKQGGDRLVVVDQAGRIDVAGLMKAVQPTEYLHEMFRSFEEVQRRLMKMESETGVQCFMHYIFDLEHLNFDPTLLGVVNGPFRVSWQLVGQHYREFIDKFIVINSPSWINVLWSALSPFIPEQSKQRIVFAGSNWREELLQIVDADCLPERYGGTLPDSQYLSSVEPVPKSLYWKPPPNYPAIEKLHKISISAAKHRMLVYKIDKPNTELLMYSHNENDITITLYYSTNRSPTENEMELAVAPIPKCGLPAMDLFDYNCEQPGYYHIKLSNEASWLLPSTYRMIVFDKDSGKEVEPLNINEKWIKKGQKPKKK
uniref:CRAL-TRIO domain-containing protein n=1 Tax=Caenorhabditis japonica TaxID=281687 RepID=A0A8R1HYR4_CAEJA